MRTCMSGRDVEMSPQKWCQYLYFCTSKASNSPLLLY